MLNKIGLEIRFSEHYDLFFTPYRQILVKSRKTILICWLWSKSTIKTKEPWHAVFIFKLEHMHNNLIFFIANFEHALVSWAQDKIHKTT